MFRVKVRVVHTPALAFLGAKVLFRLRLRGTNDNMTATITIGICLEKQSVMYTYIYCICENRVSPTNKQRAHVDGVNA